MHYLARSIAKLYIPSGPYYKKQLIFLVYKIINVSCYKYRLDTSLTQ